jgi:predicted nucleic acid binding AN1-type Zn finger protein
VKICTHTIKMLTASTIQSKTSTASMNAVEVAPVASGKVEKARCGCCRKKLGLAALSCRCGGMFCAEHRGETAHSCTFDYKAEQRARLEVSNPLVVASKVSVI